MVWGDYLDQNALWTRIKPAIDRWGAAIREAGGRVDELNLPARGIRGNSHMLMMDANSNEIAGLIQAWLAERGLMK
jgi:hypothetical protein